MNRLGDNMPQDNLPWRQPAQGDKIPQRQHARGPKPNRPREQARGGCWWVTSLGMVVSDTHRLSVLWAFWFWALGITQAGSTGGPLHKEPLGSAVGPALTYPNIVKYQ